MKKEKSQLSTDNWIMQEGMFGYFRFNQMYASPRTKRVYKNYYCGTCFALEYNYGEISRNILSYDAVILALSARLYESPESELLPCFLKKKGKKQFFENDGWKKLASINIMLMEAKIDDDINDERSTKAKAAAIIFGPAIRKAEKQYPVLAKIVREGYSKMYGLEKKGADVLEICDAFSFMMMKLMSSAYSLDEKKLDFIKAVSRWLYFIDQLDDYDEDTKDGKYNPLVAGNATKREAVYKKHKTLFLYLQDLFRDFQKVKAGLDLNYVEDRLLYAVINESIPNVTKLVLTDKKLPQIAHRKKEIEWKEG